MQPLIVKCGWCGRWCDPNELLYSEKLDADVCQTCDADNDRDNPVLQGFPDIPWR